MGPFQNFQPFCHCLSVHCRFLSLHLCLSLLCSYPLILSLFAFSQFLPHFATFIHFCLAPLTLFYFPFQSPSTELTFSLFPSYLSSIFYLLTSETCKQITNMSSADHSQIEDSFFFIRSQQPVSSTRSPTFLSSHFPFSSYPGAAKWTAAIPCTGERSCNWTHPNIFLPVLMLSFIGAVQRTHK